ncbi:hypothetical protein [Bradyrhizobium sp. BWC-3-1]|uniref:hypothetical protein n=1 Tax=unclassified Bradyrhizobium TaxID=2631580 RepID=UPI00293E1FFE|nr:hypothetical protein [Bradyrhizobium sp. BWC-3-1]WOH62773.1 hypothetical protein RX329_38210 [Bradyrhizobium sp. BWC-3-1]
MTRDNSIWHVPLMRDGVGKVGRFSWFFATSGPDGLTVDQKRGLFVAHDSLGPRFRIGAKRRSGPLASSPAHGGAARMSYWTRHSAHCSLRNPLPDQCDG